MNIKFELYDNFNQEKEPKVVKYQFVKKFDMISDLQSSRTRFDITLVDGTTQNFETWDCVDFEVDE